MRSSPEWVARCGGWRGLLRVGRNVRVSMMVECFGIYIYIYVFLERVSELGICVVVLTCVLVLVCPCFQVEFFVVIKL